LLKPLQQPLAISNPDAAWLKRTYVLFTGKPADDWLTPIFERIAARVRKDKGWNYYERPFEHWPVLDKPR
jgi:hypothetical protein